MATTGSSNDSAWKDLPILQMRTPRLNELRYSVQCHLGIRWQSYGMELWLTHSLLIYTKPPSSIGKNKNQIKTQQ